MGGVMSEALAYIDDDEPAGRRCPHCGQALPDFGGIVLDDDRFEIRFDGQASHLTGTERRVMRMLLDSGARVLRKERMFRELYWLEHDSEPEMKIVDVFVCKLRKKLKPLGLTIRTHWGVGWSLEEPEGDA